MNLPTIIPEDISITSIRLLSANISSTQEAINFIGPILGCETEVSSKNVVNMESQEFLSKLLVRLEAFDTNKGKIGIQGEFELEVRIRVENLKDHQLPNVEIHGQQVIVLSPQLTSTMMGLVYSTARGVIFMRTLGSLLDGVILPVLNPLKIGGVIMQ